MYLVVTSVTWYVTLIASRFVLLPNVILLRLYQQVQGVSLASKSQCSPFQFLFHAQDSVRLAIFRPGTREETFTSLAAAVHFTLSAFTSRTTNPASNSPTSCLRFASSPRQYPVHSTVLFAHGIHTDDLQRRPGVPIYWLLRFICTCRGLGPCHLCHKTW